MRQNLVGEKYLTAAAQLYPLRFTTPGVQRPGLVAHHEPLSSVAFWWCLLRVQAPRSRLRKSYFRRSRRLPVIGLSAQCFLESLCWALTRRYYKYIDYSCWWFCNSLRACVWFFFCVGTRFFSPRDFLFIRRWSLLGRATVKKNLDRICRSVCAFLSFWASSA